jgi:hypothetical protein
MRKAAAVVLMSMVLACGSGDTLSVTDTQAVLNTLSTSLASASPEQTATPNQTVTLDLSISCPDAGTATVTGHVTANCPTQTTCTYSTTDMLATFAGCAANGMTVDGSLAITFSGSSTSFNETMNGSLTASRSGQRVGTCGIEVAIASTPTSVSITGSACGQNVSQ